MKRRGNVGKYILRKAVEPWLPTNALQARKRGFQIPFAEWFKGDFSHFAREAWNDSGARQSGYLRPEAVEQLFKEHDANIANHGRTLYAIAMFSCWWRQTMTRRMRQVA
jgi:asparagine synthase (glutamine-hydrolysing)